MDSPFPLVRISGDAHDRGRMHGERARDRIHRSVAFYRDWLRTYANVTEEQALEGADQHLSVIGSRFPELVTEMEGIAAGAEVSLVDIVVLNARTEIAYGGSGLLSSVPSECTSFGVEAGVTRSGAAMAGQNWDWVAGTLENTIVCHVELPNGLEYVTVTEAGMLAKFGVNSAGVALCANMLASNQHRSGVPFHVLACAVLQTTNLTDALRAVTTSPRAGSGNFLLATSTGESIDVEWSPEDYAILFPTEGVLTHANHFQASLAGVVDRTKLLRSASPGTYLRDWRLRRALAWHAPQIDVASARIALSDHTDLPESICRHEGGPEHDVFGQTNASFIVDFATDSLHLSFGPPCENDYGVISFPWASDPARTAAH